MADSKRLKILKALTAQLETVTIANGYQHDLAGRVFRGRSVFGANDPVPMVSILEYQRPDLSAPQAGEVQRKKQEDWDLLVQGFVMDDRTNPTDPAHALLADVKMALAEVLDDSKPAFRLGDLITSFNTDGGLVRPPDDVSVKAHFYLRVTLKFVENEANPYA